MCAAPPLQLEMLAMQLEALKMTQTVLVKQLEEAKAAAGRSLVESIGLRVRVPFQQTRLSWCHQSAWRLPGALSVSLPRGAPEAP